MMVRPELGEGLVAGLDVVPFEPNHEREFQAGLLYRRDDTSGDDVAIHDPTEDVD